MPEAKRPLKVFLCHASQDKPLVRELSRRLVGEGWIDTWLDEKKLLPGQDWRLAIEEAVEDSDIVIICLSHNSVSKEGYVQKELRYAREMALEKPEETIFLIPLRLDECEVPRGLRFYQWVDYFGERKTDGYDSLVESLKLRYEQKLKFEEERTRKEKERQERDTRGKAAREKAKKEAAWEKVEKEAAEKVAREKAKQESAKKAKQEKAERQIVRRDAIKKLLPKLMPFLRIIGILGIIIILFWTGSKFVSFLLTPKPNATQSPITVDITTHPVISTKTTKPTSVLTFTPTPTFTAVSTIPSMGITYTQILQTQNIAATPTLKSRIPLIVYGETTKYEYITAKDCCDVRAYGFYGIENDNISIHMSGGDESSVMIHLQDQDGKVIAQARGYEKASIENFGLPYTGVFYILEINAGEDGAVFVIKLIKN